MEIFRQLLLAAFFIYLAMLLFLYLLQKKFIFSPIRSKHALQAPGSLPFLLERPEAVLRGWLINGQFASSRMIIYYGGNSEDIYLSKDQFSSYVDTAVLLVNYRGYGISTGIPGEKQFYEDALAVFDEVRVAYAPSTLFLMGKSLGAAVACCVARRRWASAIILVTPFDSLETLAKKRYPYIPVSLVLRHKFPAAQHLEEVQIPALVLDAGLDRIVPATATEKLLMHMKMKKKVVCIEEAEHNTIELFDEYQLALLQFITPAGEPEENVSSREIRK